MPLAFERNEVVLRESCGAEEALELAEWLAQAEHPTIDLAACTHVHAALLQTLLAYRPDVAAAPADPFLRRWLLPLIAVDTTAA